MTRITDLLDIILIAYKDSPDVCKKVLFIYDMILDDTIENFEVDEIELFRKLLLNYDLPF